MVNMQYTPDDYNEHDVLKVPFTLSVILFYQLRYLLLAAMTKVPIMNMGFAASYAIEQLNPVVVLSWAITISIIVAMRKRIPKARDWPRKIWKQGRFLLLFSIGSQIVFTIIYVLLAKRQIDEILIIVSYIDLMLFIYVFRSKQIRDVFNEFPELKGQIEKKSS